MNLNVTQSFELKLSVSVSTALWVWCAKAEQKWIYRIPLCFWQGLLVTFPLGHLKKQLWNTHTGYPQQCHSANIWCDDLVFILHDTNKRKSHFTEFNVATIFTQRKWFCSQDPTRAQNTTKNADYISENCYCLNTITSNSHGDFLLMERCVALCVLYPYVCVCLRGRPCTAYCTYGSVFVCMYLPSLFPDRRSPYKITVYILFCVNYKR